MDANWNRVFLILHKNPRENELLAHGNTFISLFSVRRIVEIVQVGVCMEGWLSCEMTGRPGLSSCLHNVLRKTQARPGARPQSASARTPPITGPRQPYNRSPELERETAVIASSFLMDASIMCFKHRRHDCSPCISIKITPAAHKS